MKWIYRNDSDSTVLYRSDTWLPGETHDTALPVPDTLGLTCVQEGDEADLVIFHDDILIQPGIQEVVSIPAPKLSHAVNISILCMTPTSGCECRFNSPHGCVIPIDVRGFQQTTSWQNCSRIFLSNHTESETHVSITVLEAVK